MAVGALCALLGASVLYERLGPPSRAVPARENSPSSAVVARADRAAGAQGDGARPAAVPMEAAAARRAVSAAPPAAAVPESRAAPSPAGGAASVAAGEPKPATAGGSPSAAGRAAEAPEPRPLRPAAGALAHPFGVGRDPLLGDFRLHPGVDIAARPGAPVVAAWAGAVKSIDEVPGHGRAVVLDHGAGLQTVYAGLGRIRVRPGERVGRGQPVGELPEEGGGEPLLHFEVRRGGEPVEPQL